MYYRHDLDITYPDVCDEHMLKVDRKHPFPLDEKYPYYPRSFGYKMLRAMYFLLVNLIVFPVMRLSHGLRIDGMKNLRRNRRLLKKGTISVSNHVFMWDYLCVLRAIRPRLAFFPAWRDNFEGPFGKLIRLSGGIPLPTDSFRSMIACKKGIEAVLESGKPMHIYPEGSLWFFYPDIRPLKLAAFKYAVKYDRPVLPITFSFRPRRGLYRLFGKNPCVNMHVGAPILPDKTLHPNAAAEALRAEVYRVMQEMNGIHPGDPTYNTDQNPDNYKKTM